ncbi:parasitic phase-specific protein PSP-1 [Xylona heveae TC161]|uniref:Parasitic phase-specific protein PSP-1 n=1 Tax=Xylona heveae (strain CBS 132557 / TC161) TaxID=1328760 RepID=A0A165H6B7_XYLHT|nr:parasitic phase-specific protein PSP-1 [Xylona heveae TC161]KZF23050.1 parasitic phase-specific protein PSP-1 [Xylona heveae TC161]
MASAFFSLVARDDQQEIICTLKTCPIDASYYNYLPSRAANGVFDGLFALSLGLYISQAIISRSFIGFSIAMICGCILEVLGYVGRLMSNSNPFNENGFLMQIVCLTIAPAFLAAGIYLCLSRIVHIFGAENSRLKPRSYPRIFIPCDVISLVLQAIGGGTASSESHQHKSTKTGDHIMLAGLAFQVFTLALFIVLCTDFAIRTLGRMRRLGSAEALDPTHARLRGSWKFRGFLVALALSTLCIFIRSIYRVAELAEGWEGALIKNQNLFIGFEGAIISLAVLVLNVFHPGYCFSEGYAVKMGKKNRGQVVDESVTGSQAEFKA